MIRLFIIMMISQWIGMLNVFAGMEEGLGVIDVIIIIALAILAILAVRLAIKEKLPLL